MTRREFVLLVPLLVLYLASWAFFPARPDDEAGYVTLAERLTDARYVTGDDAALLDVKPDSPDLWFGPGLPAVLAPLAAVDAPLWVMRLTGPALLFGAVMLFFVLARDTWGSRVAFLAAYVLGLYLPFLGLLSNLHSEVLAIFFVCASMLCLARWVRSGRAFWLVSSAGGLAGLALTRVAYGWVLTVALAIVTALWLARRCRPAGRAATAVALALVLCIPWLTYTYATTDRLFVWGNSGSLSLYWMASPYEGDLGDWQPAHLVFTDPALEPHRAFFSSLRGLTLAQQNAEIEREALRNIVDDPVKYGENVAANVSRMLFNMPYSRSQQQLNDLFYALPNALVVGAVALCVIVLIPRRRSLPPETGPFVVIGVVAFVLHVLVATYPRMLMPLLPLVTWLTILALVEVGVLRSEAPRGAPAPTGSS